MVFERTHVHYPNLQSCRVVLSGTPSSSSGGAGGGGSAGAGGGPVSMPKEALEALAPAPPPYDFETEREVVSSKDEEKSKMAALLGPSSSLGASTSSSSASYGSLTKKQRDNMMKMKSITNASDAACLKILRKNQWKVDASVNAYYRGDR